MVKNGNLFNTIIAIFAATVVVDVVAVAVADAVAAFVATGTVVACCCYRYFNLRALGSFLIAYVRVHCLLVSW